jgi:hypothetical protein
MREVDELRIESETTFMKKRMRYAETHGTETKEIVLPPSTEGTYITDPLRFVECVASDSPHLVIGGDKGGGSTKIGPTYQNKKKKQEFHPIVIFNDTDNYESISRLSVPNSTPFSRSSSAHSSVFSLLQHLIDTSKKPIFLNGDWLFLNELLGLQCAASSHPCFICQVDKDHLDTSTTRLRPLHSVKGQLSVDNDPLLTIARDRIVPAPLHVFLGLGNRLIENVLGKLLNKEFIAATISSIKSSHGSAGVPGVSEVHQMNGNELSRWIKIWIPERLIFGLVATGRHQDARVQELHRVHAWLCALHYHLLGADTFTDNDLDTFKNLVDDIQQSWQRVTGTQPFPKLHMLRHCLEFAQRHRFLGKVSEAYIESYHHRYNRACDRHMNSGKNSSRRLRRAHADLLLQAIQPTLVKKAS